MFNKLFLIIKKVIIAILLIYTYNIIVFPLGITIAFNVFTIVLIGIFGLPAVVGLCLFSILIVWEVSYVRTI